MIKIISNNVLRTVASSVQEARHFALMADEVTDCCNKEHVYIGSIMIFSLLRSSLVFIKYNL